MYVLDLAAGHTPRMVMGVGTPVVSRRAVPIGQLDCEAAPDQGFQALVDRGQGDSREELPYAEKDLVRRRVRLGARQILENGGTLLGEPLSFGLEGVAE